MTDEKPTTYDDAYSAALAWYWPQVRRIADEAIYACNKEREASEDPQEFLTEWVDGECDCDLVCYRGPAHAVLLASKNEDAYYDETGVRGDVNTSAFWALRADVWEALTSRAGEWQR